MSVRTAFTPGTFCWVDYTAKDLERAAAFYGGLFDWTYQIAQTSGGPPYAQFKRDPHTVSGIGQMSPEMIAAGMPPVWNNYVSVESCAAVEKKAVELGGRVMFPTMKVMEEGWLNYIVDPQGAVVATWQPGRHCGATLVNEPGSFSWNELATTDVGAAREFYGALFGWTFTAIESPGGTETALISNHGQANGHMVQMNEQWGDAPPHWRPYFSVADADATAAKAAGDGGEILVPPMDIPQGRFCVLRDPDGGVFTAIQLHHPG